MKLIAKVCLAFLLAVAVSFGAFYGHASAGNLPAVSVDVNKPINQILNSVSFKTKFNILVVNKTEQPLRLVGAYNESGNWPVGDIAPNSAQPVEFEGNSVTDSFSFASNYSTGDGKDLQFVATWPIIGSRKIGLTAINEDGNDPAEIAWDKTNDKNDKAINNFPYEARAFITGKGNSIVWVYEVKKV